MLLESICFYIGLPRNLPYHQARVDDARRRLWGLEDDLRLDALLSIPTEFRQGWVKCRVTYAQAIIQIEWAHYTPRPIQSLQLVDGNGLDYAFKYADRSGIHALMLQRGNADDILMVKNGLITDTSYCNVVLHDGSRYISPAAPLLPGTCRARLLGEGRIEPADIRPADLKYFQEIFLINAMLDLGALGIKITPAGIHF